MAIGTIEASLWHLTMATTLSNASYPSKRPVKRVNGRGQAMAKRAFQRQSSQREPRNLEAMTLGCPDALLLYNHPHHRRCTGLGHWLVTFPPLANGQLLGDCQGC